MRRNLPFLAPLALSVALGGCMTLGGTVKGNFACKAPDGVCAPTTTIDDRALAMIVGSTEPTGDRMVIPAGPVAAPRTVAPAFQKTSLDTTRTGERVLRVVFPAQIDSEGRLHEQTAVHAVVEQGDWRQASADSLVATSREQISAMVGADTLLAAAQRADPPVSDDAQTDPDMPTPAAVSAARTRATSDRSDVPSADFVASARSKRPAVREASSDPVGDIRDEVARQLAARPRPPVQRAISPATSAPTVRNVAATPSPSAQTARPVALSAPGTIVPAHATAAGRAAIKAVAVNPAIVAGLARAEPEARIAARDAEPVPVIHAASLPGVDQ